LVALEIEQSDCDRIEVRYPTRQTTRKKAGNEGALGTIERNGRDSGADESARRFAAALASALVVHEKEAGLFSADRSPKACAKNVLLEHRTRLTGGIQEIVVGVQCVVAEELVGVAVELARTGLQYGIDVAAAVASLGGVIKRSLDFEFLNHVGIGKRSIGELRHVVVGGRNAVDQIVVVVFALAVDDDAHVAAAETGGAVQFALCASREREELLEILCGERKRADSIGAN